MIELRNRFIQDVDLNEDTSLTHLLDRHHTEDDENVETQIIKIFSILWPNKICRSHKKKCWSEYFGFKYPKHLFKI